MADAKRKRPREVSDFSKIGEEAVSSATVHGVITSLSPIKKGRSSKFFDGKVSDGKKSLRLVAFSERQLESMQEFKSSRRTVELKDCQLQRARRGDQLEIVLKSGSEVGPSSKEIDVSGIDFMEGDAPDVQLCAITSKCIFDLVSVRGRVHSICKAETLESGSIKQDVVIGDSSAVGRVTIWGDRVDTLETGKCYLFSSFMVKEFGGIKYLSMRKEYSKIEGIEDIGAVKNIEGDSDVGGGFLENVNIVAVVEFVRRKVCYCCKGQEEPGCGSPPSIVSAKLLVKNDATEMVLTVYGNILRQILGVADDNEIVEVSLVCTPTLKKLRYNQHEVITGIEMGEDQVDHDIWRF